MAVGGHSGSWPRGLRLPVRSKHALERIDPVSWWKSVADADTYLLYHFALRPDAAKFEPGTQMHLGVRAPAAAVDMLLEIGPRAIEAACERSPMTSPTRARGLGATVLSPREPGEQSGILTISLGNPTALHATLTAHGIVARERMGGVRLAPHFYADASDIDRVVAAAREHRDRR
jgi:selenocysteine lyase/cysteine desulfurase